MLASGLTQCMESSEASIELAYHTTIECLSFELHTIVPFGAIAEKCNYCFQLPYHNCFPGDKSRCAFYTVTPLRHTQRSVFHHQRHNFI